MLYSVEDICKRVVELLQEGEDQLSRTTSRYSKARVLNNVNSAYASMTDEAIIHRPQDLLRYVDANVSQTTGTLDVTLSSISGRVYGLQFVEDESGVTVPARSGSLIQYSRVKEGSDTNANVSSWFEYNGTFYMRGPRYGKVRIWYYPSPVPLSQGTVAAVSGNTITLATTPTYGTTFVIPDFYNESRLRIVSGNGAGAEAIVTGYTSSRVATCATRATRATTVFDSPYTPNTSSVYSFMPWFAEEYNEYLAHLAAVKFTKTETAQSLLPFVQAERKKWMRYLCHDDLTTPHKVVDSTGSNNPIFVGGQGYEHG